MANGGIRVCSGLMDLMNDDELRGEKYLYRAVDRNGATVDFLLTVKRDTSQRHR